MTLFEVFQKNQQESFDLNLYNHAVDISRSIDVTMLGGIVINPQRQRPEKKFLLFPSGQTLIQLRDSSGNVLMTSSSLNEDSMPLNPRTIETIRREESLFLDWTYQRTPYRLVYLRVHRPPFPPLILQVASPIDVLLKEQKRIATFSWLLFLFSIVSVAIGSYWAITQSLGSVYRITKSARSLDVKNLSQSLPLPPEVELKELTSTFNELLSRVDRALRSQEQFTADASHQLKTPLALLLTEMDLFKLKPRSQQETQALIESATATLRDLSKMVDHLLLISRIDSGAQSLQMEPIRLDEVSLEVISQLQFMSREKKVTTDFEMDPNIPPESFLFQADRELIKILIYNLIENALKFSFENQRVLAHLSATDHSLLLKVEDEGPGISEQEKARIFERFHRASELQNKIPGSGLGLSIAQKIANLHGFGLSVESDYGKGARFFLQIKKI